MRMEYDEIKNEILKRLYFEDEIKLSKHNISDSLYYEVMDIDEYSVKDDEEEIQKELIEFKGIYNQLLIGNIIKKEQVDDDYVVIKYYGRKSVLLHELIERGSLVLEDAFSYSDIIRDKTKQELIGDLDRLNETNDNIDKKTEEIEKLVEEQKEKITDFYNKILEILGILIAIFSIIGFNIQGIGSIIDSANTMNLWNFVGGIAVINICIVLSMYLLLYLINRVINKNEKSKGIFSEKVFWLMLTMFLIIISICFIVA